MAVLVTPLLEITGIDPVRMWFSVARVSVGNGSGSAEVLRCREDDPDVEGCIFAGADIVMVLVDVDGPEASIEVDRLRRWRSGIAAWETVNIPGRACVIA